MKTERRHELQTNVLADWLGKQIQAIRPHANTIVAIAVIAVGAILAITYLNRTNMRSAETGWQALFAAEHSRDVEQFESVAKEHDSTAYGAIAWQAAGDLHLAEGADALYRDRAEAGRQLELAHNAYTKVLDASKNPELRQRALLGLGRCYEALGNREKAMSSYEEIIRQWPDSFLAPIATQRKQNLESKSTAEFLAWFSQQEPPPPSDDRNLGIPGIDDPLGAGTGLDLPGMESLTQPGDNNTGLDAVLPPESRADDSAGGVPEPIGDTGDSGILETDLGLTPEIEPAPDIQPATDPATPSTDDSSGSIELEPTQDPLDTIIDDSDIDDSDIDESE